MKYDLALQYATELKEILAPFCERIEIAGGVRRKKAEPHDIEIVCAPKFKEIEIVQDTLFEQKRETKLLNLLDDFIQNYGFLNLILTQGEPDKAGKRAPCGPKYYRLRYRGKKLDIFSVIAPAQWGTVFLIRTGDADFSHEFVTRLWKYNLRSVEGHIERTHVDRETGNEIQEVMPTPEETDCFKLCGMEYVEPEKRTLATFKELEAVKV